MKYYCTKPINHIVGQLSLLTVGFASALVHAGGPIVDTPFNNVNATGISIQSRQECCRTASSLESHVFGKVQIDLRLGYSVWTEGYCLKARAVHQETRSPGRPGHISRCLD